jgi:hypothetical protein
MRTRRDYWTVVGCAVLVTGTLLACKKKSSSTTTSTTTGTTTATATATAAPAPAKVFNVGDTATSLDYKITVSQVEECKPKYYFSKPKKGNIWLGVEVTVESTTDKNFFANTGQVKVIDGDGVAHNPTYQTTKNCDPKFNGTQLAKGEKAKGWVLFELPSTANGLKLSYNPTLFGPPQTTKYDLGR